MSQAQSVNTDYDLSGSLAGQIESPVIFTSVKLLALVAGATNPGNLTLFGGTNPFLAGLGGTTPNVVAPPDGIVLLSKTDAAGWAITGASNDNLRVASAATVGTYTFDLVVLGIG